MNVFDYTAQDLEKNPVELKKYAGNVLLIVNTASKCGLAGQMKELEELYAAYQEKGFIVFGFPSDQFMGQEPLEGMEIQEHCSREYGATFPLFDKIKVNGSEASDLYQYLVKETGNKKIKWNYTKFLIDQDGNVVKRYAPITSPKKIKPDIEKLLATS